MAAVASSAGGGSGRPISVGGILRYPSGTTLHFVLLIALLLFSAVYAGNWVYRTTAQEVPGSAAPWPWLFFPPLAVLVLAVAIAMGMPFIKEHRRHLAPLLPSQSPAAAARYGRLVAESGLHRVPAITWNPREAGRDALAYGRPGRYRIAVTPAILSSARRHPDAFDTIIRHELGHVRNHDVPIAYFAVSSWYALLPVLATPLLFSAAHADLTAVPEYLARVLVLAAVVYLTRAALLRAREHYADIRAVSWSQDAGTFSALLAPAPGQARPGSIRRWRALHPDPAERVLAIRDPARLGRPPVAEFLAAGFTAGAALPLAVELAMSIPGVAIPDADYAARPIVFALLGGFAGVALVRAAAAGRLTARLSSALAGVTAAGLSAGLVLSLAESAALGWAGANLIGNVILSAMCGALVILAADLLRMHASTPGDQLALARSATAGVLTAAAFALAAALLLPFSAVTIGEPGFLLTEYLPYTLAKGGWGAALAVLAAVVAGVSAAARRAARKRAVFQVSLGCAAGILAAVCATAIRWHAGTFPSDEAVWHYYQASLWIIAAGAVAAGLAATLSDPQARTAAGVLTGACAVVLGCATFTLLNVLAGDPFDAAFAATTAGLISAITVTAGLPLIALAAIAAGFSRQARTAGTDLTAAPAGR